MTCLSLWTHLASKELLEMDEAYNNVKDQMAHFRSFEDSLAGNPNFTKRLLEEARTVSELKEMRKSQGADLRRKIDHFQKLYPDRKKMITEYKILDGARKLISIAFVIMAVPFFIHVFKRP